MHSTPKLIRIIPQKKKKEDVQQNLIEVAEKAFKIYDTSGKGVLNPYEQEEFLQDICHSLNLRSLKPLELMDILRVLDNDGDGAIDTEEFLAKFQEVNNIINYNVQSEGKGNLKKFILKLFFN